MRGPVSKGREAKEEKGKGGGKPFIKGRERGRKGKERGREKREGERGEGVQ